MNLLKNERRNILKHCLIVFIAFSLVSVLGFHGNDIAAYADSPGQKDAENKSVNNVSKDQPADEKKIVAEVNGEIISKKKLIKQYNIFLITSNFSEESRQSITPDSFLEFYVPNVVLLQEARRLGIRVSPDEIENEKKAFLKRANLTEENLLENLRKAGLTMEDADRDFEEYLMIMRLMEEKLGDIKITDKQARDYYDSNNKQFNSSEKITASHILICHKESVGCGSDLPRQEAKELAENIVKIVTPKNFARLAKRYSSDSTGSNGGDLGDVYRGSAFSSFEEAAFKLDAGEISDVVETDFGFHIIYVTGKYDARSITFDEARESIIKNIKEELIVSGLSFFSKELIKAADIKIYAEKRFEGQKEPGTKEIKDSKTASADNEFPTFRSTGENICRNDKGQPVVFLYTSPGCSHCAWIGETYDSVVMKYVEMGLIEAHHYDMSNNNDSLTFEVETEMPKKHLEIFETGTPEGYVPYFNFGCMYDRIGTGYERLDDLFAEEIEMRKIIDSLIKELDTHQ